MTITETIIEHPKLTDEQKAKLDELIPKILQQHILIFQYQSKMKHDIENMLSTKK